MMLKWTSEPPTEPGYYWYEDSSGIGIVKIERYRIPGDILRLWAWFAGNEVEVLMDELHGRWAGPIPEPEK